MATTNTIDRFELIKVEDKEYKLQYTIRALIGLEKELDNKSVLNTLSDPPFSFADTFTFTKWGLIGGGHKDISDDEIENVMMAFMETQNLADFQNTLVKALIKSGAIGTMGARPTRKK